MQDTTLTIKQTLDIDPEINFINWELNAQDVASTTGRTIAGAQGLLDHVLNAAQWNVHALNISLGIRGTRCRYVGHGDNHQQSEKQNSRGLDDCRTNPQTRHNG